MKLARLLMIVALELAAMATQAAAAPVNLMRPSAGHTYFNRPGADMPQLRRQLVSCIALVEGMFAKRGYSIVGGIIGDWMVNSTRNQMKSAALENCMVVRGWRVVRLSGDEGARAAGASTSQLYDMLTPWVGAQTPPGEIVRVWGNDGAKTDTITRAMPGMGSDTSLSVKAISSRPADEGEPDPKPYEVLGAESFGRGPFRPATPAQLAAVDPGSAVLVLTVANSAPREWTRVSMVRVGPDPSKTAWASDHKQDRIGFALPRYAKGAPRGGPVSQTAVYILPPGRWAISMISDLTSTCMGAPFVDLKAGEVVNAGAIDFGRDGLPMDLDPGPARKALADQPALLERMRPAQWTNGATFRCMMYPYALEYPDLPYDPAYVRAGQPEPKASPPSAAGAPL